MKTFDPKDPIVAPFYSEELLRKEIKSFSPQQLKAILEMMVKILAEIARIEAQHENDIAARAAIKEKLTDRGKAVDALGIAVMESKINKIMEEMILSGETRLRTMKQLQALHRAYAMQCKALIQLLPSQT